ncbi:MAG: hypothetical protein ACLGI7_14030, partial [Gammaproteobacteria bacterium]
PERYRLDEREPQRGFAARLLSQFSGSIRIDLIPALSGWAQRLQARSDLQRVLAAFNDPRGVYAHCFCRVSGARGR